MGRRFRGRKRKRDDEVGADGQPVKRMRASKKDDYRVFVRENADFEAYYKEQGFVPEGEFEEFMNALKSPLPTTFRVNRGGHYFQLLQTKLAEYNKSMANIECEGEKLEPPTPLPWYPHGNAWYLSASRGPIRKMPEFKDFHQFLHLHSDEGGITRQEGVSMIPPLFLDVKAHHKVLDMCAAPGSKTSQIAEAMVHDAGAASFPEGLLVANDSDEKRCYMLVHQMNRLATPSVVVTNHEAQRLPGLKYPEGHPRAGERFKFDRVLADVPCSGDGTLRKSPDLWGRWSTKQAFSLHRLQIRIAHRGTQLVAIGGRMVYSTCSFSPVENEAVVAEILRRCDGVMELVDVSKELPLLKRAPGMSTWKISSEGEWYEKHLDLPKKASFRIAETCFPPTAEEAEKFHLERCIRMLPHHQNTGGFFVAVMQKVKDFPVVVAAEEEEEEEEDKEDEKDATEGTDGKAGASDAKKEAPEKPRQRQTVPNAKHSAEAPFLEVDMTQYGDLIKELVKFYGINDSFKLDHLLVRSEGSKPNMYYLSDGAYDLLKADHLRRVRIINMGLKVFTTHSYRDSTIAYRISFEGIHHLARFLSRKRFLPIKMADLIVLLETAYPKFLSFTEDTREQMQKLESGGVIFELDLSEYGCGKALYTGWKGLRSGHLLVSKLDTRAIKQLFAPHLNVPDGRDAKPGSRDAKPKAAAEPGVAEPAAEAAAAEPAAAESPADAAADAAAIPMEVDN